MPKYQITVDISVEYIIEAKSAEEAKKATEIDVAEWDYIKEDFRDARHSAYISAYRAKDYAKVDMGVSDGKTVAGSDWEKMKKEQADGG